MSEMYGKIYKSFQRVLPSMSKGEEHAKKSGSKKSQRKKQRKARLLMSQTAPTPSEAMLQTALATIVIVMPKADADLLVQVLELTPAARGTPSQAVVEATLLRIKDAMKGPPNAAKPNP